MPRCVVLRLFAAAFDMLDANGYGLGKLTRDELVVLMGVCMRPACRLKGLPPLPIELYEHYADGEHRGCAGKQCARVKGRVWVLPRLDRSVCDVEQALLLPRDVCK